MGPSDMGESVGSTIKQWEYKRVPVFLGGGIFACWRAMMHPELSEALDQYKDSLNPISKLLAPFSFSVFVFDPHHFFLPTVLLIINIPLQYDSPNPPK